MRASLILYPADPNAGAPSHRTLVDVLQAAGFIGNRLESQEPSQFAAGPEFLSLVCFLGCSPAVVFERQAQDVDNGRLGCQREGVHIRIPPMRDHVAFLLGSATKAPRCPVCKHTDAALIQELTKAQRDPMTAHWTCSSCGHRCPPHQLDWRRSAGFARTTIEIWGVYPAEALPDERLLKILRNATGAQWDYCYITP